MAKHSRKIQAALRNRQSDASGVVGSKGGSKAFHMPGSQNVHKTGYDPSPRP